MQKAVGRTQKKTDFRLEVYISNLIFFTDSLHSAFCQLLSEFCLLTTENCGLKHYLCCMKNHHPKNILSNLGFENLNEMQQTAHDVILNDANVLLLSPTGSGKTLAFLLPILEMLQPEILSVQCLIIVPSRELGLQIEQVWKKNGNGLQGKCMLRRAFDGDRN